MEKSGKTVYQIVVVYRFSFHDCDTLENILLKDIHTKVFASDGHMQIILNWFKEENISFSIFATFLDT